MLFRCKIISLIKSKVNQKGLINDIQLKIYLSMTNLLRQTHVNGNIFTFKIQIRLLVFILKSYYYIYIPQVFKWQNEKNIKD